MKSFLIIAIAMTSVSAFANKLPLSCKTKAEKAVERAAGRGYDRNGFFAFRCGLAPNRSVVICDVGASKGGGDAHDTYRAILDRSCSRVYRVDLTGEE